MKRQIKYPKKKVSTPRPHIEVIERDPLHKLPTVDLKDFKTKLTPAMAEYAMRAKP